MDRGEVWFFDHFSNFLAFIVNYPSQMWDFGFIQKKGLSDAPLYKRLRLKFCNKCYFASENITFLKKMFFILIFIRETL